MSTAKLLSITTFIGLVFLALIAFGFTWKVLSMGIWVSAILSIIYYTLLKRVVKDDLEDKDVKSKM